MENEFLVCSKEEAYSYDELGFIIQTLKPENSAKVELMQKALCHDKEKKAVFFMPKESFDIFSVLQGDSSVCNFDYEDVEKMLSSVINYNGILGPEQNDYKGRLVEKLEVLKKFLDDGNKVMPIVIPVDVFTRL